MASSIKNSGQVYTPKYLVKLILDEAGYYGPDILNKHCIDNSCGDGAFLCEIITRYVHSYANEKGSTKGVADDISHFIHGIEIDELAFRNCLANLSATCNKLGVSCSKFDIINADALKTNCFDGRMDFVIGNPPYVRVHNLEQSYNTVKKFSFATNGMTDLYLVFFEKGFQMLNPSGKLCYITPSSWLNSLAGTNMRDYIRHKRTLVSLLDLEHFQAFKASTYTLISLFQANSKRKSFTYNTFDASTLTKKKVDELQFNEIDINNYFYIAPHSTLSNLKNIFTQPTPKYVSVKNGFATLSDNVFIADKFPFSDFVIPAIKASTGKWRKAFFPYTADGKPIDKRFIFNKPSLTHYLESHKKDLLKGDNESAKPFWYLYGRTQALKDVAFDKLAINTTIKDIKSIKINYAPAGTGLYSGLYVLSNIDFDFIKSLLLTEDFIKYVASLKKYKSGGYYTYNSKDLEMYLNATINTHIKNGTIQIPSINECGLFASNLAFV